MHASNNAGLVHSHCLHPAGILTYRLLPLPKPTLKTIHATVNGLGLFFAVFGLWAVLKFHALRQIPDFYSLHSWFGMATIVLVLLQVGPNPCTCQPPPSAFLPVLRCLLAEGAEDPGCPSAYLLFTLACHALSRPDSIVLPTLSPPEAALQGGSSDSWHSQAGVLFGRALWLSLCASAHLIALWQWLVGLYTYLYPGAPVSTRQVVMPWHTFMGIFIFVLALTTASQGALEKLTFRFAGGLAKRGAEALLVNSLGLLFFVWGALVLLTLRTDVRRVPHQASSLSG